jgi:membrane-bound lytic murein transglycosylase B
MKLFVLVLVLLTPTSIYASLTDDQNVIKFIDEMVLRHSFDRDFLLTLFSSAKKNDSIIEAISRPAERKPWYQYRPIFITELRINEGVKYWKQHSAVLSKAEAEFGIPAQYIVAIIGVESLYGRHRGRYRVIDSLTTLGFYYPKRSRFFRQQLEHYLLMTRNEDIDPLSLMGSYAGAMGQPQFIASSYIDFAIDYDGDGKRDLWDNANDIIGSVANYLSKHRWNRQGSVATPAVSIDDNWRVLSEKGYRPSVTVDDLVRYGIKTDNLEGSTKVALVSLEAINQNELWLVFDNFYVLTRYNHSPLYAMAVHQLAEAIKSAL